MLAIIGGTGLSDLDCFQQTGQESFITPFSTEEVTIFRCRQGEVELAFLPRHGAGHAIPPHKINYRANIWALSQLGVKQIVAVNAVGGINVNLGPGAFAVPDQIIDYSHGRDCTFFEDDLQEVTHIDFTHPYDQALRQRIIASADAVISRSASPQQIMPGGVYACMQGPRLETAAEIQRLKAEGCDMVGMTAMPEAALARELNIAYACLALSVNWGAGLADHLITLEEIHRVLDEGMGFVAELLQDIAAS